MTKDKSPMRIFTICALYLVEVWKHFCRWPSCWPERDHRWPLRVFADKAAVTDFIAMPSYAGCSFYIFYILAHNRTQTGAWRWRQYYALLGSPSRFKPCHLFCCSKVSTQWKTLYDKYPAYSRQGSPPKIQLSDSPTLACRNPNCLNPDVTVGRTSGLSDNWTVGQVRGYRRQYTVGLYR